VKKRIRTFLDAGVLFVANAGKPEERGRAVTILANPDRQLFSSPFLALELIPHARHNRRPEEVRFYEAFLAGTRSYRQHGKIVALALEEAARCDLKAIDALHVAAAHLAGCQEFITTEKPTKPLYRTQLVSVRYFPQVEE
jgi:hypothetical protein